MKMMFHANSRCSSKTMKGLIISRNVFQPHLIHAISSLSSCSVSRNDNTMMWGQFQHLLQCHKRGNWWIQLDSCGSFNMRRGSMEIQVSLKHCFIHRKRRQSKLYQVSWINVQIMEMIGEMVSLGLERRMPTTTWALNTLSTSLVKKEVIYWVTRESTPEIQSKYHWNACRLIKSSSPSHQNGMIGLGPRPKHDVFHPLGKRHACHDKELSSEDCFLVGGLWRQSVILRQTTEAYMCSTSNLETSHTARVEVLIQLIVYIYQMWIYLWGKRIDLYRANT